MSPSRPISRYLTTSSPAVARKFIEAIFGEAIGEDRRLNIWTKGVPTVRAASIEKAIAEIHRRRGDCHVTTCLHSPKLMRKWKERQGEKPSTYQRGCAESATVMLGVSLDIDFGDHNNEKTYPPNREAALDLIDALLFPPTVVVHTVGGLHAWWLFTDPWCLESDEDRDAATVISYGWHVLAKAMAEKRGWTIDSVYDLARVLRVPGYPSPKPDQNGAEIRLDEERTDFDRRYTRDQIEEVLPVDLDPPQTVDAATSGTGPLFTEKPSTDLLREADARREHVRSLLDGLRKDSDFEQVWSGRRRPAGPANDTSLSAYRQQLVSFIVRRLDWPPEDVLAAVLLWCEKHGHDYPRADLPRLFTRDWGTARKPIEKIERLTSGPTTAEKLAAHFARLPDGEVRRRLRTRVSKTTCGVLRGDLDPAVKRVRESWGKEEGARAIEESGRKSVPCKGVAVGDMLEGCTAALHSAGRIYRRGARLVTVVRDERGEARILTFSQSIAHKLLADTVAFVDEQWRDAPRHPREVVQALCAEEQWDPGIRQLTGVTQTPTLLPDGQVFPAGNFGEEQHHAETGVLYVPGPRAQDYLPVPEKPTHEEAREAVELLIGPVSLVCDFGLVDDASYAAALALMLALPLRFHIDARPPVFLLSAPQSSSGKTLLVRVIVASITGKDVHVGVLPEKEDEIRKVLFARVLEGRDILFFDNIKSGRRLQSAALEAFATAPVYGDRILGVSATGEAENRAVLVLAGNNLGFGTEAANRILPISLDPKTPHPERRTSGSFKHPQVLESALAGHPDRLHAALTLLRAWYAEGSPIREVAGLAQFADWMSRVAGVLGIAGVSGFGDNLAAFHEEADIEGDLDQATIEGLARLQVEIEGQAQAVLDGKEAKDVGGFGRRDALRILRRGFMVKDFARYWGSLEAHYGVPMEVIEKCTDPKDADRAAGLTSSLGYLLRRLKGKTFERGLRLERTGKRSWTIDGRKKVPPLEAEGAQEGDLAERDAIRNLETREEAEAGEGGEFWLGTGGGWDEAH